MALQLVVYAKTQKPTWITIMNVKINLYNNYHLSFDNVYLKIISTNNYKMIMFIPQ